MSIQINDINDFHVTQGKDGRWAAWPYEALNMVAEGETEQEAIDNLLAMCQEVADYENSKMHLTNAIGRHFAMTGIEGLAECIWQAFEKVEKEKLDTRWYCNGLIQALYKEMERNNFKTF